MTPERIKELSEECKGPRAIHSEVVMECLDAIESVTAERDLALAHVEALQRDCAAYQASINESGKFLREATTHFLDEKQALSDPLDAEIKRNNALARYARHTLDCELHDEECICGLNDLLAGG